MSHAHEDPVTVLLRCQCHAQWGQVETTHGCFYFLGSSRSHLSKEQLLWLLPLRWTTSTQLPFSQVNGHCFVYFFEQVVISWQGGGAAPQGHQGKCSVRLCFRKDELRFIFGLFSIQLFSNDFISEFWICTTGDQSGFLFAMCLLI